MSKKVSEDDLKKHSVSFYDDCYYYSDYDDRINTDTTKCIQYHGVVDSGEKKDQQNSNVSARLSDKELKSNIISMISKENIDTVLIDSENEIEDNIGFELPSELIFINEKLSDVFYITD